MPATAGAIWFRNGLLREPAGQGLALKAWRWARCCPWRAKMVPRGGLDINPPKYSKIRDLPIILICRLYHPNVLLSIEPVLPTCQAAPPSGTQRAELVAGCKLPVCPLEPKCIDGASTEAMGQRKSVRRTLIAQLPVTRWPTAYTWHAVPEVLLSDSATAQSRASATVRLLRAKPQPPLSSTANALVSLPTAK